MGFGLLVKPNKQFEDLANAVLDWTHGFVSKLFQLYSSYQKLEDIGVFTVTCKSST